MNKCGEEGDPGVSLGRWENREEPGLSREHQDQQVEGKQKRPGYQTEGPASPEELSWDTGMQTGSSKRDAGNGEGDPDMDRKEDGNLW